MEVFRLLGSIFIDNDKANKSIDDTDKKGKGLAGTLTSGIATAAKWGAAIGAAAVAAGGALFAMSNKAAATTDRIDKLSQKIGMSRQGFQEWDFIMSQSGGSIESLQSGFKTLVTQVDQAVTGTGKGAESFRRLGISVTDANGAVKDQETIFNEAVVALQNMEDGTEKAALANQLFGRSGAELMPLLNGAAGSVDELRAKAHELGLVLGDDAIDAGVLFTDTVDQLKRAVGAAFTQIGTAFIPIMQKMADWIIAHMPQIRAIFQTVFDAIGFVLNLFVQGIQKVIAWLNQWAADNLEQLNGMKETFMAFFEAVQNFISAFVEFATVFWDQYGDQIMAITSFAFGFITETIDVALKLITDLFNVFAALFRGDWEALWEGVKSIFTGIWNAVIIAIEKGINIAIEAINIFIKNVNRAIEAINSVPGVNLPSVPLLDNVAIPRLADGGTIRRAGLALVGEAGPELLNLPRGAQVTPLPAGGGGQVVFGRGAFEGAVILDDYGVDRLMDRIFERMNSIGSVT